MKTTFTIIATAGMAALANAHGYFTSPAARQPGNAFKDACGQQAYYNMDGNINGNIQGLEQVTQGQPDYHPAECELWKCKGMKYQDNTANVHHYTAGQSVPLHFNIQAPHTGTANVSIIDLATNTVIGKELKTWSVYASNSVPIVASQESFDITIPSNLGNKCATAGKCAIQMHWNAESINQTYQSCIDMTVSGSGKRSAEVFEVTERNHARDFKRE